MRAVSSGDRGHLRSPPCESFRVVIFMSYLGRFQQGKRSMEAGGSKDVKTERKKERVNHMEAISQASWGMIFTAFYSLKQSLSPTQIQGEGK